MIKSGDVVTTDFHGATGMKRRPCVVVSTETYHQTRPDVILGLLTTQVANAKEPSDYLLEDWTVAGFHKPSAYRTFLFTLPAASVAVVGRLTNRDWNGVQIALAAAIATQ